ncbi:glycine--tRNA ligase subunit beta [Pacificimonas flava]|nr:glycine--tRNA ligase subunit beta [Pacificimonas flava]MBB5280649.1 glycyl-tRNA synthetase beta chain [Pacificimonas flava]
MSDFLLELLSEEIPARMQKKACADLERLFTEQLAAAGVRADTFETHATPRRLALIARGLPQRTEAAREERRGPRTDAPDKAVEGFLRGAGLSRDQLETREEKKGSFYYAVIETPGRAMADILAEAVPAIVRSFPWPKSMRWGEASRTGGALRWVRPLQGIVALLNGDIVPCAVGDIESGRVTRGHRFLSEGPIEIEDADSYEDRLRAARVILRTEEREAAIFAGATEACAEAGLTLIEDDALLSENAGLTEWPVPLLGRFDADFLAVPPEVIQLAMKTHQKYFSVADETGTLTNAFVCTANIEAKASGRHIAAGNEKVLAARLADARFFWEQDLKLGLEAMAPKLSDIVFHEKLGTTADKVARVAKLARWLVEEGIVRSTPVTPAKAGVQIEGRSAVPDDLDPGLRRDDEGDRASLADQAERAAKLSKADLVSGMVGEFPELQGIMGGYYAEAAGEDPEIAAAIRDHYKPVGQNDDAPTAPVTVAVSLADKLDVLVRFFEIGERPTGSRDPFALRRTGLSIIKLIVQNSLREHLDVLFFSAAENRTLVQHLMKGDGGFYDFFADRLKVQQREAGVRHDLIDAVFALGGEDDIVRLLARVKALQGFMEAEAGAALLTGYRRAANILKAEDKKGALPANVRALMTAATAASAPSPVTPAKAGVQGERPEGGTDDLDPGLRRDDDVGEAKAASFPYTPEPAEAALSAALNAAVPAARTAVAEERFADAMTALSELRAPVDRFFDDVTVNDEDEVKRAHRLALLARLTAAAHAVADFSQIEG